MEVNRSLDLEGINAAAKPVTIANAQKILAVYFKSLL